jgi:hypothetical protein
MDGCSGAGWKNLRGHGRLRRCEDGLGRRPRADSQNLRGHGRLRGFENRHGRLLQGRLEKSARPWASTQV